MNKTEIKIKAAKALEDAADFLKRRNRWCTGYYSTVLEDNSTTKLTRKDGKAIVPGAKFCAMGALAVFSAKSTKVLFMAHRAMSELSELKDYSDVEDFNDSQMTKGPVMRAMRKAARNLMSELEGV